MLGYQYCIGPLIITSIVFFKDSRYPIHSLRNSSKGHYEGREDRLRPTPLGVVVNGAKKERSGTRKQIPIHTRIRRLRCAGSLLVPWTVYFLPQQRFPRLFLEVKTLCLSRRYRDLRLNKT